MQSEGEIEPDGGSISVFCWDDDLVSTYLKGFPLRGSSHGVAVTDEVKVTFNCVSVPSLFFVFSAFSGRNNGTVRRNILSW